MSDSLTVHICSFSYHKTGIPEDNAGHGGGFVFDCRFLPNPGRESRYADLDGRDEEVRDYLLSSAEAESFWTHVREMIDAAVDVCRARNFTDMSVAFGCTGGQHRSVFFAERLFAHLSKNGATCGLDHMVMEGGSA